MTGIIVEMFREERWKPIGDRSDPSVAVDGDGAITVTLDVGYIQPPWRVSRDGVVIFERSA